MIRFSRTALLFYRDKSGLCWNKYAIVDREYYQSTKRSSLIMCQETILIYETEIY